MIPKAILFDYGGVLAEVEHPEDGPAQLVESIGALLDRVGQPMERAHILQDLMIGLRAYDGLKRAQSRMREPAEVGHREFWELVGCDWRMTARAALLAHATPLCRQLELTVIRRPARLDAAELLTCLRRAGVRTALVCNCLSGDAARDQLGRDGLAGMLDVELYSDEVGYRKPGPALLRAAMAALDVAPSDAWFVGDRIDRDVLAARRAGIETAVLFRTAAGPGTLLRGVEADHEIDQLMQLPALMGLG